jgi:hypothetical protein
MSKADGPDEKCKIGTGRGPVGAEFPWDAPGPAHGLPAGPVDGSADGPEGSVYRKRKLEIKKPLIRTDTLLATTEAMVFRPTPSAPRVLV